MRVSARKVSRFVSCEGRHRELLNLTQLLKKYTFDEYIFYFLFGTFLIQFSFYFYIYTKNIFQTWVVFPSTSGWLSLLFTKNLESGSWKMHSMSTRYSCMVLVSIAQDLSGNTFGNIFFLGLYCGPLWKGFSPSPADKC